MFKVVRGGGEGKSQLERENAYLIGLLGNALYKKWHVLNADFNCSFWELGYHHLLAWALLPIIAMFSLLITILT